MESYHQWRDIIEYIIGGCLALANSAFLCSYKEKIIDTWSKNNLLQNIRPFYRTAICNSRMKYFYAFSNLLSMNNECYELIIHFLPNCISVSRNFFLIKNAIHECPEFFDDSFDDNEPDNINELLKFPTKFWIVYRFL